MTGIHGQNRAMIESSKYRGFIAHLDRAETKHGLSTGMRMKTDGDGLVMVSATLYPKVKFHIQDVLQMSPTYVYGPHRDLTQEEWNATGDFLL
jgi:hypothetical protein